jgi:hypothetical protein
MSAVVNLDFNDRFPHEEEVSLFCHATIRWARRA